MTSNRTAVLLFMLFMILLAGCSGSLPTAPQNNAAATPAMPSATPQPTASPTTANTLAPSPLPSQTLPPSATATTAPPPSPTPDPALAAVRLLGVSWQKNYDLLLAIEFAGPVNPELYRVMVEDKLYACQINPLNPNRLVCIGQGLNVNGRVTVRIYPEGSDLPGFEGKISIPYFTK